MANKFASVELDWAEKQLNTWQQDLNDNPYNELEDRTKLRPTKNGGSILEVIATREAQQKHQRETMKDYLALLEIVKRLRKEEAERQDIGRGGETIPVRMRDGVQTVQEHKE